MSDAIKLAIDALEQATEVDRLGIINAAKHGLLKKARESRDSALAALRAQPDHSELVKPVATIYLAVNEKDGLVATECIKYEYREAPTQDELIEGWVWRPFNVVANALEGKAIGETK